MTKHPAKFSPKILSAISDKLQQEVADKFDGQHSLMVLDPFGGTGLIHRLARFGLFIMSIELEEEWSNIALIEAASSFPMGGTYHGDFFDVTTHWRTGCCDEHSLSGEGGSVPPSIDIVVTSPTYGNRMADHHNATDTSTRNTYKHTLGRDLTPGSSAVLQWGDEYRAFHTAAWRRVYDIMVPGGLFILNVKDHIRKHTAQGVPAWHKNECVNVGFVGPLPSSRFIPTKGNRQGQNGEARTAGEYLYVFRKPVS